MTFIVEGRRFDNRHAAITFAAGLANEQDRSVDVEVEVEVIKREARRSWVCRMHPEGVKRTITAPLRKSRALSA